MSTSEVRILTNEQMAAKILKFFWRIPQPSEFFKIPKRISSEFLEQMASTNFWLQSLKPHNPVDIRQQPPLRLHRSIVLLQFRELVEIARILFQLCALSPLTQNSKNSSNCSEQQCALPYFDEKKEQSKTKIVKSQQSFVSLFVSYFESRVTARSDIDPMTRNATPLLNQAVHHLHLDSIGAASLPN